jgi:hypothetical protein
MAIGCQTGELQKLEESDVEVFSSHISGCPVGEIVSQLPLIINQGNLTYRGFQGIEPPFSSNIIFTILKLTPNKAT